MHPQELQCQWLVTPESPNNKSKTNIIKINTQCATRLVLEKPGTSLGTFNSSPYSFSWTIVITSAAGKFKTKVTVSNHIVFCGATGQIRPRLPLLSFLDHTQLDTRLERLLWKEWSASLRSHYPHNTQWAQEMNVRVLIEIQTCNPSNWAAAGL
jgi:hypothetical protein